MNGNRGIAIALRWGWILAVLWRAAAGEAGAPVLTPEGRTLRDALVREAEQPGKPAWRAMLLHLAELHGQSVLPPIAHFKFPYL
jgi:hypothetical protein